MSRMSKTQGADGQSGFHEVEEGSIAILGGDLQLAGGFHLSSLPGG
jgi:hypothetical protein